MRWWRRAATVGLAVPALTLAAALTTVTPATPVSSYGPGIFAFTQTTDRGFSYHVYVSNTAGTERRLLTTRRAVGRPAISPDGRRVAFSGPLTDDSDGRYGIYVINMDGTGLRLLSAPRFADFDPAWSPDGRVIAFTHNANGNGRLSCCAIGLMYADGSSRHLVPGTTYGLQPAWSPDSARLTYSAYDGLHAVNTNGSGHSILVRGTVGWPAWSPDGSRIAYVRAGGTTSQVQVVPSAGGVPVAVESVAAFAESPTWGVDGSTLYYVLFHGYGDEGRTDSSVWRSTAPGAAPGRLFSYGTGLPANVYGLAYYGGPLQLPTKPSAVSWGNGRLDVFVRGTNAALYHKYYAGGSWSEWESLGGALTGNPEAVSWGNGRLDVFVRGTNGALYHRAHQSSWSEWESLGGALTGNPEAVSWGNGRLDVFVRGTNAALYHRYYAGAGWPAWQNRGGILTSDPAAASREPGSLDVAVRGANGSLYVESYDGGWRGFRGFGGSLGGEPDATSSERGSVDIAASGSPPDLPLLHVRTGAAGRGLLGLQPGPLGGMPETASRAEGVLDVFYRGSDGRLRHQLYDGRSWSTVEDLGGLLPAY